MKNLVLAVLLFAATCPASLRAQNTEPARLPAVPTTKVLAIGHLTGPRTPEIIKLLASDELPDTVKMYLSGKIDQWYSLTDRDGVVFVINASSVSDAQAFLGNLPFVQKNIMTFELIPIGPLSPLALSLPHASQH
ncbi:hypothetical protein HDF16_002788 [Granulicella aggregans]|uniref:Muconolactone delta-isomerase n=1 Tax=Granulicella aggregans TaxID=474949 RepID=A0A7W8E3Z1_9BACT|nr:hypothetical protein [Granulicella aggregans]MBB5058082.1 hypothetical protein [Granulicella aggregans]